MIFRNNSQYQQSLKKKEIQLTEPVKFYLVIIIIIICKIMIYIITIFINNYTPNNLILNIIILVLFFENININKKILLLKDFYFLLVKNKWKFQIYCLKFCVKMKQKNNRKIFLIFQKIKSPDDWAFYLQSIKICIAKFNTKIFYFKLLNLIYWKNWAENYPIS